MEGTVPCMVKTAVVQTQKFYGGRSKSMAKYGVSSMIHTEQQLDAYANQHNPNNKAYKADHINQTNMRRRKETRYDWGILDGESYGWCDD